MTNNENKIPVIALIGSSHCGSTLMNLILDSHSQIAGVGKLSQHQSKLQGEEGICGCGKKLKECEFWQEAFHNIDPDRLQRFSKKGIDFLLKRNYSYADYTETTEKVYRNILASTGKKVIFDSSKVPDRAEVLLQNPNLDMVFLHLVRDGRGVAYSNIKRGRPAFYFMKRWAINNIKVEIIKIRNRQAKTIFILYEDFAKNPEKIIKHILKEVGLPFEPEMLSFKNKVHHLVGNYSLLFLRKDDQIKPSVEWKEQLPLKDRILFDFLFGWLNIFYKIKPKKYL